MGTLKPGPLGQFVPQWVQRGGEERGGEGVPRWPSPPTPALLTACLLCDLM